MTLLFVVTPIQEGSEDGGEVEGVAGSGRGHSGLGLGSHDSYQDVLVVYLQCRFPLCNTDKCR